VAGGGGHEARERVAKSVSLSTTTDHRPSACIASRLTRDHVDRIAEEAHRLSRLQAEIMELLRGGTELAQLVDGCACRRECERLERFGEHPVEAITRRNARGDVRTEMLAG
jgi:hypothetical protein